KGRLIQEQSPPCAVGRPGAAPHLEIPMPDIRNARFLILAADGFEQLELTVPRDALRKAGAKVDVASPRAPCASFGLSWTAADWSPPSATRPGCSCKQTPPRGEG